MWKQLTMSKMWTGEHLSNVITPDISRDQSKCGEIEKLSIFVLSTPIPHLPEDAGGRKGRFGNSLSSSRSAVSASGIENFFHASGMVMDFDQS